MKTAGWHIVKNLQCSDPSKTIFCTILWGSPSLTQSNFRRRAFRSEVKLLMILAITLCLDTCKCQHACMTLNYFYTIGRNVFSQSVTSMLFRGVILHPSFSTGSTMGVWLLIPCSCKEIVSSLKTITSLGPGKISALFSYRCCSFYMHTVIMGVHSLLIIMFI